MPGEISGVAAVRLHQDIFIARFNGFQYRPHEDDVAVQHQAALAGRQKERLQLRPTPTKILSFAANYVDLPLRPGPWEEKDKQRCRVILTTILGKPSS